MKKKRVIPVLLLKNGNLVQSRNFSVHQNIGNPMMSVKRFSEWNADELIYLDITRDGKYDLRRDDLNTYNQNNFKRIIDTISKNTFMPLTVGGKIKSVKDVETYLRICADKVCINSEGFKNKKLIKEASYEFGSQCIVSSIDVKKINNNYHVFVDNGKTNTEYLVTEWIKQVQQLGAGEILLNSIDQDGRAIGYDLELIELVEKVIEVPLVICGGAGSNEHFKEAISLSCVDAVAASNFFHHKDQSVYLLHEFLYNEGLNVRKPNFFKIK